MSNRTKSNRALATKPEPAKTTTRSQQVAADIAALKPKHGERQMTHTWFRPYIVMSASAKMPSRVRAPYRHAAILKTDGARVPQMIRECLGAEIVLHSGPLHARGKNTAFSRAYADALVRCQALNDACEIERMVALGVPAWRIEQVKTQRA